jgi:hypothetical protein
MKNKPAIVAAAEMSAKERAELGRLEHVLDGSLRAFYDTGLGLKRIRDGRLYRGQCKTFEQYVEQRWDMHRDTAYAKIAAAEVVQNVGTSDKKPNEFQASKLVGLDPDLQCQAWTHALEIAPKGRVTAAIVAQVVEELTGRPPGASAGEISEEMAGEFRGLSEEEQLEMLAPSGPGAGSGASASAPREEGEFDRSACVDQIARRLKQVVSLCRQLGPEAESAEKLLGQAALQLGIDAERIGAQRAAA